MKLIPDFLKSALSNRTAEPDHGDVAGFVVHDRNTGHIVHREHFDSGRFDDDRLTDKMITKRDKLEKKYAPSRFEVEHGLFNSREAFFHFFPDS